MGSPSSEEGRRDDEGPQYRVTIPAPFAVGVHEVTFDEWDACVAAGGCRGYSPDDKGWGRGRRPVIGVSWTDARTCIRWLSDETGESYRLLSEAEWEYAARAETATRYHWGDDIGQRRANCDGCGSRWDGEMTAPAGGFGANAFGLRDVHGHVREWVEDCRRRNYRGAPTDVRAWLEETGGECHRCVLRGGSWRDGPMKLRAASRLCWRPRGGMERNDFTGFRVARAYSPPESSLPGGTEGAKR